LTQILFNLYKPGDKILDGGCATGGYYMVLNEQFPGIDYSGIDLTPAMISRATKNYPGGKFKICSIAEITYEDNTFDTVFSSDVRMHLNQENCDKSLTELYRVSKKNLVLTTRLKEKGEEIVDITRSYQTQESGHVEYNLFLLSKYIQDIKNLKPTPKKITIVGEYNVPHYDVTLPNNEKNYIRADVTIEKGDGSTTETVVDIQIKNKFFSLLNEQSKIFVVKVLRKLGLKPTPQKMKKELG
jgi:hypothetical protein